MVDQEFKTYLKDRMGPATWNKASLSDIEKVINDDWEYGIKRNFTGDNGNSEVWDLFFPEGTLRHYIALTS